MHDNAGKTKHVLLAEQLRERIQKGELAPGDRLPSHSQMLEEYGLSRPTVERAHSLLMQEGLIVLEQRRGAFVAQRPQTPSFTRVLGITGLYGSAMNTPHDGTFIGAVQVAAAREGWEVLLLNSTSEIRQDKVDGILNQDSCPDTVIRRLPAGIPFVSTLIGIRGMNNILADEKSGIEAAVEHLYELGHRRIAYLVTTDGPQRIDERIRSYKDSLLARRIEMDPRWLRDLSMQATEGRTYRDDGRAEMQRWLKEDWRTLGCTALLVQNDDSAVGAIEALQEAGIRVPQEVSVIGFDGAGVDSYFTPKLTTVEVPLREIGQHAVELLLKQIRQGTSGLPITIALPTRLKIGESTAPTSL